MSSVQVSIDLHNTSRGELDVRLRDLEISARQKLGGDVETRHRRTSDGHFEAEFLLKDLAPSAPTPEPLVLTSAPLNTNTKQGLGQFDRSLAKAVDAINKEKVDMSNVTGASFLGDQFRANLAAVKDKIGKAGQKMNDALKELDDTATQASQMADQVSTETADLKAAMGLHSNNPPA